MGISWQRGRMAERTSFPPKPKRGRPTAGSAAVVGRLALRVTAEDLDEIGALVRSFEGFDQPTICRAALRLGLTLLQLQSSLLLVGGATPSKRQESVRALIHKKA